MLECAHKLLDVVEHARRTRWKHPPGGDPQADVQIESPPSTVAAQRGDQEEYPCRTVGGEPGPPALVIDRFHPEDAESGRVDTATGATDCRCDLLLQTVTDHEAPPPLW